uniref:MFS domain-containing protein n=1 Tax=Haemonchus contortus TaxID=6289 RepID=A0A7I4YJG8_HAECO
MTPRLDYTDRVADIDKCPSSPDGEERLDKIEKTTPWLSVYVAALCSFVQALQFGLFFSSLWPYLKRLDPTVNESFFGYVVAIYSLGSCIASPAFGYWSNRIKQVRIPTIFGFNMMLLGNLIYLMLDTLPTGQRYAMAVSRVMIGIGSSNAVLLRTYASTASVSADRTRSIGCVAAGIAAGLVIGPGLQALFTPLGEDGLHLLPGWSLDMYKAPALLAAIVNICGIALMYFVFDETYAGLKDDKEAKELPPADLIAVAVCIVTRFTQLSVSTNIETLGSAYSMMMFDLSAPDAVRVNATSQAVQGVAAAVILLPFLFLNIGKRLRQRTVNIACVLGFIAFHLITYPWGFGNVGHVTVHPQESELGGCDVGRFSWCTSTPRVNFWVYYVSLCSVFEVTYAFSNVVLSTVFSKIIGPRRQGTMQGVFQMSGSIARMTEPILLNVVYAQFGPRGVWLVEIGQLLFTLSLWLVFLKRLVPLEKRYPLKDEVEEKRVEAIA